MPIHKCVVPRDIFGHLPIRGMAMCIKWACSWSCADASSAWSPSRSFPRISWGTLHPHPFRSAKRVKRKDASRSCATGSNGLRKAKAFGFPSSSSCATARASCVTGVPCSSAILPGMLYSRLRGELGDAIESVFTPLSDTHRSAACFAVGITRSAIAIAQFSHARAAACFHADDNETPPKDSHWDLPRELPANKNYTIPHRRRLTGTVRTDKMDALPRTRRYRERKRAPTMPPPRCQSRALIGRFRTHADAVAFALVLSSCRTVSRCQLNHCPVIHLPITLNYIFHSSRVRRSW